MRWVWIAGLGLSYACGLDEPSRTYLSAGAQTCHLDRGGSVRCWGEGISLSGEERDAPDPRWPVIDLPARALDVAAADVHACAVLRTGAIACWGDDVDSPRLGYASPRHRGPVLTEVDAPFVRVAVGKDHSCGVTDGGALWCWGSNTSRALGHADHEPIGDDEAVVETAPVPLEERVVSVAAASGNTCVLLEGGGVRCWGHSEAITATRPPCDDACPNRLPTELEDVPLPEPAVSVAVGRAYACAVGESQTLYCWGGKSAFGNFPGDAWIDPAAVELDAPVLSVSVGYSHACALLDGGRIRCWGNNDFGKLGLASLDPVGDDEAIADAATVRLGQPAVAVAAGVDHTCVAFADGQVKCWGEPGASGRIEVLTPLECFDERPNPDTGHGSPPTLYDFDCTNGSACCVGDDEHPEEVGAVPL